MQHKQKLTAEEKFNIWLDLCDFTFRLMKDNLPPAKFKKRLKKMRQEHLEVDHLALSKLLAELK